MHLFLYLKYYYFHKNVQNFKKMSKIKNIYKNIFNKIYDI